MTSHRERNDRRSSAKKPQKMQRGRGFGPQSTEFVWGVHAAEAALSNPERTEIRRILATPERADELGRLRPNTPVEILSAQEISRRLPPGAAHQGAAVETPPLEGVALEDLADPAEGVLLMLDQVTDPQNVGTILRSSLALGARGLILQDRHAPALGGALAKASAGALERLQVARVVNLARALDRLSDLGWTIVGLSGEADLQLDEALDARPTVLVLGSEGEGMRRLVAEHCDATARIAMPGGFESLNVSAAAAIALYEALRRRARHAQGEPS